MTSQIQPSFEDKLTDSLPIINMPESFSDDLHDRVMSEFDGAAQLPVDAPSTMNRILRLPTARIAASFLLLAAIAGGVFLIFSGTDTYALDRVVDKFSQIDSVKFKIHVSRPKLPATKLTAVSHKHFLLQRNKAFTSITDFQAGVTITLNHPLKRASRIVLKDARQQQHSQNFIQSTQEILERAKKDPNVKHQNLGEKKVAGQDAIGFRFTDSIQEIELWTHEKTSAPILIRVRFNRSPDMLVTLSGFELTPKINPDLFSMKIPVGYTLTEIALPADKPGKE